VLRLYCIYLGNLLISIFSQLRDALYQNLVFYICAGIAGIVYIFYMVVARSGSPSEVIGFLMAMGNTYGVLLIIVLMGNGLVALPRRLWQLGNAERELVRLYLLVSLLKFNPFTILTLR